MTRPKRARSLYPNILCFIIVALAGWLGGCGGGGYSSPAAPGTQAAPTLSSVTVTPMNPSLALGGAEQFALTGTYSDGSTQNLTSTATWISSQPSVATINSAGFATSKGGGTTIITGTSGSLTSSTTLVIPPTTAAFSATGGLHTARQAATATLLNNGLVLIAGGIGPSGTLASAELYNPSSGVFISTGNLNVARGGQSATLLNNGMVLLVGGFDANSGTVSSAEIYNPATGTFSLTGSPITPRGGQSATLLNNGMVLIAGGGSMSIIASAELYNPATGTFTPTGSLNTARWVHSATLLNNGTVLIAGGFSDNRDTFVIGSAEIYDPASGGFSFTGPLVTPRGGHTANLLNNGTVLIAGGNTANTVVTGRAEIFNPATGTFLATGNLATPRTAHSSTLLNDGTVLIAGGGLFVASPLMAVAISSNEIYNPTSGTFGSAASLNTARLAHTATLLSNGSVLATGGESLVTITSTSYLSSAEVFVPGTFTPPSLVSIKVAPSNSSISSAATQRFTATGTFSDNSTQTLASVTWTSSNSAVASISNDITNPGVAVGVATGTATIIASAGSIMGATSLTVH
jgi:hypothetical protein